MNLHTDPKSLSEVVRNVVLARAHAGHINGEGLTATRLACRESARSVLYKGRLSSREAEECDAIAAMVRTSQPMVAQPAMLPAHATLRPYTDASWAEPSRDDSAVLEALRAAEVKAEERAQRLEGLLTRFLAFLEAFFLGSKKAPQMGEPAATALPPARSVFEDCAC